MPTYKISELPVEQKIGNRGATPGAQNSLDLAFTWNNALVAFQGDYLNYTDTASDSESLILSRAINSVLKYGVRKDGSITIGDIAFTQNAAGSVERGLKERAEDYPSVKDFGVVGDGIADDYLGLQAALDSNQTLKLPKGLYRITSELIVDPIRNRNSGFVGVTGLSQYYKTQQAGGPAWLGTNETTIIYDGALSATACVIRASAELATIEPASLFENNVYGFVLKNVTLDGNSKAAFGLYGARLMEAYVDNVIARGTNLHGVYCNGIYSGNFSRLTAMRNNGCGITFGRAELDYGWAVNARCNAVYFNDLYASTNGADKQFVDGVTVPAWLATTAYKVGDVYQNAGTSYYVNTAYTSGATFGATDTTNASVSSTSPDAAPAAWIASHAYAVNDQYLYLGEVYKVRTAYTSGATYVAAVEQIKATNVSLWGYGVGLWLHRGNVVTTCCSELNDGPGIVIQATSSSNVIGGGYTELSSGYSVSGTTALADGRTSRSWAYWLSGYASGSSLGLSINNTFHASSGIRLTGVNPSSGRPEQGYEFRNLSGATYLLADNGITNYRLINCNLELNAQLNNYNAGVITTSTPVGAMKILGGLAIGTSGGIISEYRAQTALTLTLRGATVAGTGWAFSVNTGSQTKIGDQVFFTHTLVVSAVSADATGQMQLAGLTYPVKAGNAYNAPVTVNITALATAVVSVSGRATQGGSVINLNRRTAAATADGSLLLADIAIGTSIYVQGSYFV